LISRPDRVLVWASQLRANDFPPVCARTGQPAETWRKFRFATAPTWAYALLVLICTGIGLIPIFIIMAAVSRRASGHLPLTKSSSRTIGLTTWIPVGLLGGTVVLWILAAIVAGSSSDQTTGAIAAGLVILSLVTLVAGGVGVYMIRPLVRPRGKVMEQRPGQFDKLVELHNVHPAFVAAVNQIHEARAAQYAAISAGPNPPTLPQGSP
jgi:hypothetical protein